MDLCKIFRIQDKRPIIFAGGALLFFASFMHEDITNIIFGGVQTTRSIGSLPLFVMPVVALIVAAIRKKGGRHAHKAS